MNNLRVAVLMGGWSGEREVSLTSAASVIESLKKLGHTPYPIDVKRNLKQLLVDIETAKPDVIFNALHGVGGEDGVIQGVLEFLQIPYTHCGVTASAIAMDKLLSRQIFEMHNIPVPKYKMVSAHTLQVQNPLPFPYVIKPKAEGSSLGIYIIKNDQDRITAMQEWNFGNDVIAEEYVAGHDIFVAIINEKAVGAVEVKPLEGFYSYESKYTENKAVHICPAPMPEEFYNQALEISEKAHHLLGCRGVTRTDLRYDDTVTPNRLVLLEINTQPGLTPLSLVPDVAHSVGMTFEDLVQSMILAAKCD